MPDEREKQQQKPSRMMNDEYMKTYKNKLKIYEENDEKRKIQVERKIQHIEKLCKSLFSKEL